MKVWILTDGEVTPADKGDQKKLRTWRLADALINRGHEVTWWASNFNHFKKIKIINGHKDVIVAPKFKLKLLEAGAYAKNISFARMRHHHKLGKEFANFAPKESPPDIIIASMPILEFPMKAIRYAKARNIPVIIDIRDKWPDSFHDYFPLFITPLLKIAFYPYNKALINCLKNADGITSMSEDLLNWATQKAHLPKRNNQRIFHLGYDESSGNKPITLDEFKNIPKNKIIFGYLGTFGKTHDIELILKAAKKLENDDSFQGHFLIAGGGEKRHLIEKLAANCKNVTVLRWLSKEESAAYMEFIDVGLTPCINTALPNKVFESLFFGNPIVFSMTGEAKTLLEKHKAGTYYQKGDVNSLISALKALTRHTTLQGMKKNARILYDTHLRSEKINAAFCEFIEKSAIKDITAD